MVHKVSLQQVNRFLFFGVLLVAILYFARQVLIPLLFSMFFAMLFAPLSNRFENAGIKRGLAAFICTLLIVIAVLGVGTLLFLQSRQLSEKFPQIEKRSQEFMEKAQGFISEKLHVPEQKQDQLINKKLKETMQKSGKAVEKMVAGIVGGVAMFVVVLIFTFLFLLQRAKYEAFFIQLAGDSTQPDASKKLVNNISTVAQSYLRGRLISICIFGTVLTVGFLIVGLEGAFLLGFLAAVLTIIPYLGSIIGGLLPFSVALMTGDSNGMVIGTLTVLLIANVFDNYIVEPNVVGGEVNISAFFTLLILFIGGALWGVAGMVLFLPLLGVTKIVCDAVPELKPFGFLIGDQRPGKPSGEIIARIRKLFGKSKS